MRTRASSGILLILLLLCLSVILLKVDARPSLSAEFGDLNNWTIDKGTWTISDCTLEGTASKEALVHAGDTSWMYYQVTVNMRILTSGDEAAIVVRYTDSANFYWLGLGCWGHKYSIGNVVDGEYSELAFSGLTSDLQVGKWYNTSVVAVDDSLKLYVDGSKVLEVQDSSHPNGAVGFRTYNGIMQAEQLVIQSLDTPPATPSLISPINGANVEVSHYGFVGLSWSDILGATDYQVAYYGNSYGTEDTPSIFNCKTNSLNGVNFGPSGSYFWKVRTHNSFGYSAWSETWSFTTYMTPPFQATSPIFSPEGGTYSSAQSVTISCSTSNATIGYTTDGSEPTSASAVYSDPILVSTNITIKAKVFSFVQPNSNTSSATYTINPPQAAVPTFNSLGGTYDSPQSITLTCSTSGATIRYTLDGTEPTSQSTVYSGPISVSSNSTIRVKAFKTGMEDSDVASATYIFSASSEFADSGFESRPLVLIAVIVAAIAVSSFILAFRKKLKPLAI